MIANALTFINKQLNEHFKNTLELEHTTVAVSRLTNPDRDGKLILTLVNIEEDALIKNPAHRGAAGNEFAITVPPMSLNLEILVSVAPQTPYVEGMKILSQAIVFFNENPVFNRAEKVLPEGIDKLTIGMMPLDADTKKALWQSLGTTYQPSVIYKMRLIPLPSERIEAVVPEIK